jgi:hypothetical protein
MKRLGLIIAIIPLLCNVIVAQNYIGMSQSSIRWKFGTPDKITDSVYVYSDPYEDGTNIYLFTPQKVCYAFVIKRGADYFRTYQKLLRKDFNPSIVNKNSYTSKNGLYKAELIRSETNFELIISSIKANREVVALLEK